MLPNLLRLPQESSIWREEQRSAGGVVYTCRFVAGGQTIHEQIDGSSLFTFNKVHGKAFLKSSLRTPPSHRSLKIPSPSLEPLLWSPLTLAVISLSSQPDSLPFYLTITLSSWCLFPSDSTSCAISFHHQVSRTFLIGNGPESFKWETAFPVFPEKSGL